MAPARRSARTTSASTAAIKPEPASPAKGSLGVPEKPGRRNARRGAKQEEADDKEEAVAAAEPKRKRVKKEASSSDSEAAVQTPKKRSSAAAKKEEDAPSTPAQTLAQRKLASHARSHGQSPYPRWPAPHPTESHHVAHLLGRHHGYLPESEGGTGLPHFKPPSGEDKFGGCGDVQDVLEATVRTILSCNTSGKNSRAAHQSMVERFGRNDWRRVLAAPEGELEDALRCGGLAKTKARNIQLLLAQTKERYGSLSLQHLYEASDAEVLETLLSFKGCGPKVASCVALFCLGRPEMAVDAHIFRLSKALSWVPPNATRETTYYHLNERIPRDLRYPLHVLLIQHGKACPNCTAKGGSGGDKASCPLRKEGLLGRKMKLLPEEEVKEEDGEGEVVGKKEEDVDEKKGVVKKEEGSE